MTASTRTANGTANSTTTTTACADASTDVSSDARTDARTDASTGVRTDTRTDASTDAGGAAVHLPAAWFEIPARDLDRAQAFYERLLATTLRREQMGPAAELAIFPYPAGAQAGGCLARIDGLEPSRQGTLVYLQCGASIDPMLARLAAAGGRLVTPKVTLPGDLGVFAHIEDTEGNRVGLHGCS